MFSDKNLLIIGDKIMASRRRQVQFGSVILFSKVLFDILKIISDRVLGKECCGLFPIVSHHRRNQLRFNVFFVKIEVFFRRIIGFKVVGAEIKRNKGANSFLDKAPINRFSISLLVNKVEDGSGQFGIIVLNR